MAAAEPLEPLAIDAIELEAVHARLERIEGKVDDLTRRLDELLTRFGPMLERAEARFNRTPMFGRRGGQE